MEILDQELEDNEKCLECGHLGIYHLRESADSRNGGCVVQVRDESIYSRRCKCLVRRKERE